MWNLGILSLLENNLAEQGHFRLLRWEGGRSTAEVVADFAVYGAALELFVYEQLNCPHSSDYSIIEVFESSEPEDRTPGVDVELLRAARKGLGSG